MKHDRIRENLEVCLKDECVSAALHNEMIYRVKGTAPARISLRPKKFIAAMALVLILLVTTAAAITVVELVRREMEPVRRMETDGQPGAWNQAEKLAVIDLMQKWGFELDEAKLALLHSGLPQAEEEKLTYEIIWDCLGERLQAYWRSKGIPTDQPEEFPLSSGYALYEALWLMNDPNADAEEIRASYEEWEAGIRAGQTASPVDTPVPDELTADQQYAALMGDVDAYMADTMSMSTRERSVATITAELNEKGTAWQVVISVKGSLLREETRDWFHRQYLYGDAGYDAEADIYAYPYVFTAEGGSGGASTLDEYDWMNLVPAAAYPEMPEAYADYPYFDPLKCFLYASAAEKAAFSKTWKPVVDVWLENHPDYRARLIADGGSSPLYRITRHHYGTPPEGYVQQEEALRIAVMHAITLRPDVTVDQLMNRCHHVIYYDVCDLDNPQWRIELDWDADRMQPGDPMVTFLIVIDPKTGEVICDQRTISREEALRW